MPRSSALDLLKRYGDHATSFQLLEPGIEHWFSDRTDAFAGYADTGRAWVVLGAPVAAASEMEAVHAELAAAARAAGRRLRFFALEAPRAPGMRLIEIGEQPEWQRGQWARALAAKRSLREQLRRARAHGVVVTKVDTVARRADLEKLAAAWRASRSMATMRFAVRLDLFHNSELRRAFVATRGDEVVAAVVCVPIFATGGWLIEDLLRIPSAPNGTTELLFDAALRSLEDEGAEFVTMGLSPLTRTDSRLLAAVREATPWLFNWRGLRSFKAKLGPSEWRPIYAAWPKTERGLAAIADVLRCFAGGTLAAFAVRTAVHRYRAVLWLLAIFLVPWMAALSSSAAARYFPSELVRAGWIGADALLFAGLCALALTPRPLLAGLLAAAAALDAALGAVQLVLYNAARASGIDWLLAALALLAPALAFLFLTLLCRALRGEPVRQ